jgi:hypothetical protein
VQALEPLVVVALSARPTTLSRNFASIPLEVERL